MELAAKRVMNLEIIPCSFGSNPRVVITRVDANLSVKVWKEQIIRVETEGPVAELHQEGNTLVITNCNSDLDVSYPIF